MEDFIEPTKRYKIVLTGKQIEAVTTALFEYGETCSIDLPDGSLIEKYNGDISTSIYNQCERQHKEWEGLYYAKRK
jgi:hypothetical protein